MRPLERRSHQPAVTADEQPSQRLKPSASHCARLRLNRNRSPNYQDEPTVPVPPNPANSIPSAPSGARVWEMPLSSVLNEKLGKILLVMIPFTAFGRNPGMNVSLKRLLRSRIEEEQVVRSSE